MKSIIILLSIFGTFSACVSSKNASSNNDKIISITHGTSFGHCRGYCVKEVIINATSSVYTQWSRDSITMPLKRNNDAISSNLLPDKLFALVDSSDWKLLPESIGCPDCADGGAEYVVITTKEGTKKVTFEFGQTPKELEKILLPLRAERARLEAKYP